MRWTFPPKNTELQKKLSEGLGISPIAAQILVNRGIRNLEAANGFFSSSLSNLSDPFLLPDMERGVERIAKAVQEGEKITICGDYDVDGVTSTALLLNFFNELGLKTGYRIPNRLKHGYGLKKELIDEIKEDGTSLIITVDNGSNNIEEIEYAKSLGMDVVVTDHHELSSFDKDSKHIIINPKRPDSRFPLRDLAGVGVVFNLLMALRKYLREAGAFKTSEPNLRKLLDLVALGTVADVVPLLDENRLFVRTGISEIMSSKRAGISELIKVSGLDAKCIDTTSIAFRIAPRINAPGRIGDQNLGVEILTTEDSKKAAELAKELNALNSKRQAIEDSILNESLRMIDADASFNSKSLTALVSDEWHPGVIGIVANRLSEIFRRPSIIITRTGDEYRGSLRSIGRYNIMDALKHASHHLIRFGGHSHAAGINIRKENIENFIQSVEEYVSKTLPEEERESALIIDAIVSGQDINEKLLMEIESLKPFGEGNPEPSFVLNGAIIGNARIVGANHLKMTVHHNGRSFDAIGFGLGSFAPGSESHVDIAFTPQFNEWNGYKMIQLKVMDIKTS